jgi:hypothetical protein
LEKIADQVKSIRDDADVGIYHPAESWDERGSKNSDLDVEERIEKFHDRVHRNRSFSCSGNVPWNLDVDDDEISRIKHFIESDGEIKDL